MWLALSWQRDLTPSPKAETPAGTAGCFAYLLLVFSRAPAGQASLSAPGMVAGRAREATGCVLRCRPGSAQVVCRGRRPNEREGCLRYPSSGAVEEGVSIFIFSICF